MIRFFRHYVPVNFLLLVLGEGLLTGLSVYLGAGLLALVGALPGQISPLLPMALALSALMLGVMTAVGLYNPESPTGLRAMLARVGPSFLLGGAVIAMLHWSFPGFAVNTPLLFAALGVALAGVLGVRVLFDHFDALAILKPRALVLGTGSRAATIEHLLRRRPSSCNPSIVGYVALGTTQHFVDASRILDTAETLPALARRLKIQQIILAVRDRRGGALPMQELLECKLQGIEIHELSTFFERENGHLQIDSMNIGWMVLSEGFDQGSQRDAVKRGFDVCASVALLTVCLPLMLLAALLIKLESRGPALYRQERIGQGGVAFTIYKFRSMRTDAEHDGKPRWAGKNDDRITRVGWFIRRTRIDELPQIFNVLGGSMSFVGPRPERPYFVNDLARQIPFYNVRHIVKPGITGWAQVRYPYGATVEDAVHKLQYDLYYVKNHSFFLDIMVLFQTAQVVVGGHGVR